MKKIIGIHQPNFFPWLPTLLKEELSDMFIVFDHVEFSKNGWTNRCQYSVGDNQKYLTLPIKKTDTSKPINEVRLGGDERYYKKLSKSFSMIPKKLPGKHIVEDIWKSIEKEVGPEESLSKVNLALSERINAFLGIETQRILSSKIDGLNELKKSDLVESLVKEFEGDVYLTGAGGLSYLTDSFRENCLLLSPSSMKLQSHEINTVDFICQNGESSRERFKEIAENFRKENLK